MISTFKNRVPGGFLVTAWWRQNKIPKADNRFTCDETRADNIIRELKKNVLQDKMIRLLNHRSQIMNNYGGLRTETKLKAIETLKNNLHFISDKSLESNCKLIVASEALIMELIPGISSTYYESTKETITQILDFCKQELKNTL